MRFFSLLMGSFRKNGRLGDPALPSLAGSLLPAGDFAG
jgi:hypothetical protein